MIGGTTVFSLLSWCAVRTKDQRCSPSSQDAACWLRKAGLPDQPSKERAELLKEMARALQLLSARMALRDSAEGQKPARQVPLVAPWASREPEDDEMRAKDAPIAASGLDDRCALIKASC